MASDQYFFYVLLCNDQSLYSGYTTDLKQRLEAHQSGKGAKYTRIKSKRPLKMIYAEQWDSKSQAMSKEYAFKRLTRQQKLTYLNKAGVNLSESQACLLVDKREKEAESHGTDR